MVASVTGTSICARRSRAILAIMYYCGLRRGEVVRLEASQVRLDVAPRVHVRRSKNGKGRDVPVDARAIPAIVEWQQARDRLLPDAEWFFCTVRRSTSGFAAGNPPGSAMGDGEVNRIVKRAAREAGVTRRVRSHMLRHSCATNWLNGGLTLEHVRILLGHTSIATTQVYLHVALADIEAALFAMRAPDRLKVCPWCAEEVKVEALKCRYCGEMMKEAA